MNRSSFPPRTWDVLLLGGASGVGKTAVSYRLAHHFGIGITEVDDFQVLLQRMTTPEQFPALHFWQTHPAPHTIPPPQVVEQLITLGRVMNEGLEAVIGNHLESNAPIVLEGDFILPELAARDSFAGQANNGRVRALFLYEEEAQIVHNLLAREPDTGEQRGRARVSWLYGQWLQAEAERYHIPALPARPWETVFERIMAAPDAPT